MLAVVVNGFIQRNTTNKYHLYLKQDYRIPLTKNIPFLRTYFHLKVAENLKKPCIGQGTRPVT